MKSSIREPPEAHSDRSRTRFDRILLVIGSLCYLGFVPAASGTIAVAVVGIPLYLLLTRVLELSWLSYTVVTLALTLVAVYVSGEADRILGEKDSRKSVIDELPGYLIALIGLPVTWQIIVAAFFLERAIDIAKVPPANWIEKKIPGGWGVVLDDVVAGLYTLAILNAGLFLRPGWFAP
jgi:phosphatidylglycerophosphatase A